MNGNIILNRYGKIYSILMSISFLSLSVYLWFVEFIFSVSCLLLAIFFLFFFYKELDYDNNGVVIYYPLRPFFRKRKIEVEKIKRITFRAYGGASNSWPFLGLRFSKYPFYSEFRISDPEEIKGFFLILSEKATFIVKSKDKQNQFVIDYLNEMQIKSNIRFKV